jgi:hypothetical protein
MQVQLLAAVCRRNVIVIAGVWVQHATDVRWQLRKLAHVTHVKREKAE